MASDLDVRKIKKELIFDRRLKEKMQALDGDFKENA